MPVYNGEKYLTESLESILEQTYTDFELIIRATSTGRTETFCQCYAVDDDRIRASCCR